MTALALTCAGLAVWLWVAPADPVRRRLVPTPDHLPWFARGRLRRLAVAVGSLALVVALGVLAGPAAAAVGLTAMIAAGAALRLIGLGRRTRAEHTTRAEVANACSVIANQVRVGRIPAEALSRWEQLLRYAALRLGRELGADVQVVLSRKEAADPSLRATV